MSVFALAILTFFIYLQISFSKNNLNDSCSRTLLSLYGFEDIEICQDPSSKPSTHPCRVLLESSTGEVHSFLKRPNAKQENEGIVEIEIELHEGFPFLSINAELWIQQLIESSQVSFMPPQLKISLNIEASERVYDFEFIDERFASEKQWNVFRLKGHIALNRKANNSQKIISDIKLLTFQSEGVLIQSLVIKLNNYLDSLQHSCGVEIISESINCLDSHFVFNPTIQSCVVVTHDQQSDCSPELNFFSVATHTCIDNCSQPGEFAFYSEDLEIPVCLEGYQTCDVLAGCRTCNKFSTICFACKFGYYLNESTHECLSDDMMMYPRIRQARHLVVNAGPYCTRPICMECMGGSFCLKCKSPFVSLHGQCVLCGRGYELTDGHYCKVSINQNSCSNYDDDLHTCLGCFNASENADCSNVWCVEPNYFSALGGCLSCDIEVPNCQTCSYQWQCTQCTADSIAMVDYYALNPITQCAPCSSGFYIDLDNFCAPCGMKCDVCTQGSLTCTTCAGGYVVDTDYSIKYPTRRERCVLSGNCSPNCVTCSSATVCTECLVGFGLVYGTCQKCGIGCKVCTNSRQCTECWDGTLNQAICTRRPCSEGYFVDQDQNCQVCTTNCLECWNPISCDICNPGFVIEKNLCSSCPSNCQVCSDTFRCIACYTGYYLLLGVCTPNTQPCTALQYEFSATCSPCMGSCVTCGDSAHCTTCLNATTPRIGICLGCQLNQYVAADNTCQECPDFCYTCRPYKGCTECVDGYWYNSATKKCVYTSICRDGNLVDPMLVNDALVWKTCDDNNITGGDGCSSSCQIESNYSCVYIDTDQRSYCYIPTNSFQIQFRTDEGTTYPILILQFSEVLALTSGLIPTTDAQQKELIAFINEQVIPEIKGLISFVIGYRVINIHSDGKGCDIQVFPRMNLVNRTMSVNFSDSFLIANKVSSASIEAKFPDTRPISQDDKSIADLLAQIGAKAGKSFIISVIPAIIFSKFSVLFNALDLFQMLYYLQFVKVRFPYNVDVFLRIMTEFQLPYSMNFIGWFLDRNSVESPDIPQSYEDRQKTGVYLVNAGDDYSQIIIIGTVHLVLFGVTKLLNRIGKSINLFLKGGAFLETKLRETWQWGWYLDKYWEMYLSVVVGCSLQIYGITFGDVQSVINSVVFIISIIFIFVSPAIFTWIIFNHQNNLQVKETKEKWGMLYETLKVAHDSSKVFPELESSPSKKELPSNDIKSISSNKLIDGQQQLFSENGLIQRGIAKNESMPNEQIQQTSPNKGQEKTSSQLPGSENELIPQSGLMLLFTGQFSKYFYIVLYLRKLFFGVFIVVLYSIPMAQLTMICAMNAGISVYLIVGKPFEKNSHGIKGFGCEVFMIIAQVSLITLIPDSEEDVESDRMRIGWVFIGACLAIMLIQLVFVIGNVLFDMYKQLQEFLKKRAEAKKQKEKEAQKESPAQSGDLESISLKKKQENEESPEEIEVDHDQGQKQSSEKSKQSQINKGSLAELNESSNGTLIISNRLTSKKLPPVKVENQIETQNDTSQNQKLIQQKPGRRPRNSIKNGAQLNSLSPS